MFPIQNETIIPTPQGLIQSKALHQSRADEGPSCAAALGVPAISPDSARARAAEEPPSWHPPAGLPHRRAPPYLGRSLPKDKQKSTVDLHGFPTNSSGLTFNYNSKLFKTFINCLGKSQKNRLRKNPRKMPCRARVMATFMVWGSDSSPNLPPFSERTVLSRT